MQQKHQPRTLKDYRPPKCRSCNSRSCRGGKKCYGYDKECYCCGETGHIKGAKVCHSKGHGKSDTRQKRGRQIHYVVEESSSCTSDEDRSDSESSSEDERPVNRVRSTRACRYVGHVRRAGIKGRTKNFRSRYEVCVLIKEKLSLCLLILGRI